MEIKAVQFTSPSSDVVPDCLLLQLDSPQDLERFQNKVPDHCGLVVTLESLSQLRQFKDLVLNRGLKNKHKGLAPYLLGQDPSKILLIEGTYESDKRTGQGVRAMISQAADNEQPSIFVVGVDVDVFSDLWTASAKHNLLACQPGKKAVRQKGLSRKTIFFPG